MGNSSGKTAETSNAERNVGSKATEQTASAQSRDGESSDEDIIEEWAYEGDIFIDTEQDDLSNKSAPAAAAAATATATATAASNNSRMRHQQSSAQQQPRREHNQSQQQKMSYWQMAKAGYQQLVNAIIRPPRCQYHMSNLGPVRFEISGKAFMRKGTNAYLGTYRINIYPHTLY